MIFSNFALEVGVVFFLIAAMMYLSLSGKLDSLFRSRAYGPLLGILLLAGLAVYFWGSLARERFSFPTFGISASAPPTPEATAKKTVRPLPIAAAPRPRHTETIAIEEVPARSVAPPDPQPLPTSSDPYESKAKRGIKAIGRFLRDHPKKATP
jgi:hypothetical protein